MNLTRSFYGIKEKFMAKTDEEKKYYVDNARLRQVIIEYNRINIDDKR